MAINGTGVRGDGKGEWGEVCWVYMHWGYVEVVVC